MRKGIGLLFILGVAALVGTSSHSQAQNQHGGAGAGAVFVMSNDVNHNAIFSFKRNNDGSLVHSGKFTTNGRGSGGTTDPLGSQGSLTLSEDKTLLFAVNAGSGDLSMFRVSGSSLSLLQIVHSGGSEPVAVAQHGSLVFVVNGGGTSNVVGFRLQNQELRPIPNSSAVLSTGNSGPGSIALSPDGKLLLVTEKVTSLIDAFPVHADGTLGPIVSTRSDAPGAFAVLFAPNGAALVAETGPIGSTGESTIASYSVAADGALSAISPRVATEGSATCWLQVTPDGKYVYTANSGTSSVSGFVIASDGSLQRLPGTVLATFADGSTNIDTAITSDGKFLYTVNTGTGTIGILRVEKNGSLSVLDELPGLPIKSGLNGIAAN